MPYEMIDTNREDQTNALAGQGSASVTKVTVTQTPMFKEEPAMTNPKSLARDPATTSEQLRSLRSVYDPQVDRLLARHPQSPPDLLETLSHSADRATRRNVARHPSTPKDILLRLAPQFPGDFLRNPVVDWLLIEEPDLLQTLGKGVVKNVLKSSDCPESLMGWAVRHGTREEQLAITMNPLAEPHVLQALSLIKGSVGMSARAHIGHPKLGRISTGTSRLFAKEVQFALSSLEPDFAVSYWRKGLLGPAQWPLLNAKSRAAVMGLSFPFAEGIEPGNAGCKSLAKSPQASDTILAHLAKHPNSWIREAVTQNPNVPIAVLNALTKDPNWSVSYEARSRRGKATPLPSSRSTMAARDLLIAASHPSSPPELLARLARRRSVVIRWTVAANQSTPESVRNDLVLSLVPEIGIHGLPRELQNTESAKAAVMKGRVVMDARHWWHKLRLLAHRHGYPRLPARLSNLDLIERFQSEEQTFQFSPNASLAAEIMGIPRCRPFHMSAASIDKALKEPLYRNSESDRLQLVGLPRLFALIHSNAPVDALVKAYRSVEWLERMAVARNINAPQNLLVALKKDANHYVSRQAVETEQLQNQLQQWPNLAKRVCDSWQISVAGVSQGVSMWDGYTGETSEILEQLNLHRKALEVLAPNVSPASSSLDRVLAEIVTRLRNEELSEHMWSDPAWINMVDIGGLWDWINVQNWTRDDLLFDLRRGLTESQWNRMWGLGVELPRTDLKTWIAGHPLCPSDILATLQHDDNPRILIPLANNTNTPETTRFAALSSLLTQIGPGMQITAEHPGAPAQVLVTLAHCSEVSVRRAVASNPATPAQVLVALSRCSEVSVRRAVAFNPATPSDCLISLATDDDLDLRRSLATSRVAPSAALEILSRDGSPEVRREVAANPNVISMVLTELSGDQDEEVRCSVAKNSSSPPTTLALLSRDGTPTVRRSVAENLGAPSDVLAVLSQDLEVGVRHSVAKNPGVSLSVIETLSKDADDWVREGVIENPHVPLEIVKTIVEVMRKSGHLHRIGWNAPSVACNPATAAEFLGLLSESYRHRTRCAVAANAATPANVLDVLSKDSRPEVREQIASRHDIPIPIIEGLAKDKIAQVRLKVAQREDLPPSLVKMLALDKDAFVRLAVATSPAASLELVQNLLAVLAQDKDQRVRSAVAGHPSASLGLLKTLANDDEKDVRWSAVERLRAETDKFAEIATDISATLTTAMQRALARVDLADSGQLVLSQKLTPSDVLRSLYWLNLIPQQPRGRFLSAAVGSPDWLTRLAVALHPEASVAQRKLLSQDSDPDVAAAANLSAIQSSSFGDKSKASAA